MIRFFMMTNNDFRALLFSEQIETDFIITWQDTIINTRESEYKYYDLHGNIYSQSNVYL